MSDKYSFPAHLFSVTGSVGHSSLSAIGSSDDDGVPLEPINTQPTKPNWPWKWMAPGEMPTGSSRVRIRMRDELGKAHIKSQAPKSEQLGDIIGGTVAKVINDIARKNPDVRRDLTRLVHSTITPSELGTHLAQAMGARASWPAEVDWVSCDPNNHVVFLAIKDRSDLEPNSKWPSQLQCLLSSQNSAQNQWLPTSLNSWQFYSHPVADHHETSAPGFNEIMQEFERFLQIEKIVDLGWKRSTETYASPPLGEDTVQFFKGQITEYLKTNLQAFIVTHGHLWSIPNDGKDQDTPKRTENAKMPLQSAETRGRDLKLALFESSEMLPAARVAEQLKITTARVSQMTSSKQLFAVRHPVNNRSVRYPIWQLDERVVGNLPAVLKVLDGLDGWEIRHFFVTADPTLRGLSPLEVVRAEASTKENQDKLNQILINTTPVNLVVTAAQHYITGGC